jgi:hypothetical protein
LLAQKHFTNPLVAVPSAVSVVCMAVIVFLAIAQTYCFDYSLEFTTYDLIDSHSLLYSLVGVALLCFGGTGQYLLMTRMTSRNEKSRALLLLLLFFMGFIFL